MDQHDFNVRFETNPRNLVDFKVDLTPPPLCAPKFCYILRKNQLFSTSRSRIHKRQKTQTSGTFLDVVKKNNSMCTHQAHDEKFDLGLEWKKSDADFGGGSALFF